MLANPLQSTLERLHRELSQLTGGDVATYIPELGQADPGHFGIAVATVDGHRYSVGDHAEPFTIQSISKPFVYGLALDDLGVEAVLDRVGVEPSGDAFNAISLEPGTGRPRNPMINAGAIASAGMIAGAGAGEKFERIRAMLSAYAGRDLEVSESVFRSEKETGHRNRAIGHLLRNAGILDGDVDAVCDRYFRQCAVLTTADDLAMMAATLANAGVNPVTGARAVATEHVERLLAVMSTCGMYDAAGAWVYRVGMPAKSGVGGGVLAVLPGQLGIGVFSPRLDSFGNSVRGVAACEALSREFGLHLLRPPLSLDSVVRAAFDLAEVRSRRRRTGAEAALLAAEGHRAHIFQLQGSLVFSTAELVFRRALERIEPGGFAVFDLRRVTGFDDSVGRLLLPFFGEMERAGVRVIFAAPCRDAWSSIICSAAAGAGAAEGVSIVADLDAAIEVCEEALLADVPAYAAEREVSLEAHPLVKSLDDAVASRLAEIAVRQEYAAGDSIIRLGDVPDAFYLLAAGQVEVSLPAGRTGRHRLSTQGPGTTFGELGLIDGANRAADVTALTDAVCYAVPLAKVSADRPTSLRLSLVAGLAVDLAERLRHANAQIAAVTA
jgi:glutaminase